MATNLGIEYQSFVFKVAQRIYLDITFVLLSTTFKFKFNQQL